MIRSVAPYPDSTRSLPDSLAGPSSVTAEVASSTLFVPAKFSSDP